MYIYIFIYTSYIASCCVTCTDNVFSHQREESSIQTVQVLIFDFVHQVRTSIAPKGFHTGRVDGRETPVEMEMAGVITTPRKLTNGWMAPK